MNKIKIFIDGSVMEEHATGIAKTTQYLYNYLAEVFSEEIEISVIYRKELKCALSNKINRIKLLNIPKNRIWRNIIFNSFLFFSKYDYIHFPWNGDIPLFTRKNKNISTIHDVLPLIIPNYFINYRDREKYLRKMQQNLDRSSIIFTDSEFSKNEIKKYFNVSIDPIILPFGETIEKTNEILHPKFNESYFFYVGGYDKRKGIDKLLKVFIEAYKSEKIKSKLFIAGKPYYFSKDFEKQITYGKELGCIEEKGYITDLELMGYLSNAEALVYPSKYEGFGLPPLEAMKLGCPVITTHETSIPEVCGNAALYIDIDNEEEFKEALVRLEKDGELREKMKEEGYLQSEKFSWEVSSRIFMKTITSQIGEKNEINN